VSGSVCVVSGAGTPGADGYSAGAVAPLFGGVAGPVTAVPDANGLGQVIAAGHDRYLAVGAAYSA
jgi:hypothetical protein